VIACQVMKGNVRSEYGRLRRYELTGRQCWVPLLQYPLVLQQVLYWQSPSSKSGPQRPSGRKLTPGLSRKRPTTGLRGPQFCSQLRVVNQAAAGNDGYSLRIVLEARLTLQAALVRLRELVVAGRLDKVEGYVGVGLRAEKPNGK
jgi:hypothetical protein